MLPAEVRALATAANKGDQGAALELRLWCEENPGLAARVGEAVAQTTDDLCAELAGADRLGNLEAIKAYARELHRQLVGRDKSTLADLAAKRVVANWLHLAILEAQYAGALQADKECTDERSIALSFRRLDCLQRWLTLAENRFSKSVKALAKVRRLSETEVRILIG